MTLDTTQAYLVVYDIADPRRLRRVHATCLRFGDPLQESVFLCRLALKELVRLQARLAGILRAEEDSVRYYPLCDRDMRRSFAFGVQRPISTTVGSWVV